MGLSLIVYFQISKKQTKKQQQKKPKQKRNNTLSTHLAISRKDVLTLILIQQ